MSRLTIGLLMAVLSTSSARAADTVLVEAAFHHFRLQRFDCVLVPVRQEQRALDRQPLADPFDQLVPVRMTGIKVDLADAGADLHVVSHDPHHLRAIHQQTPQGARSLVPRQQYSRL